jgi:hypothetical protein
LNDARYAPNLSFVAKFELTEIGKLKKPPDDPRTTVADPIVVTSDAKLCEPVIDSNITAVKNKFLIKTPTGCDTPVTSLVKTTITKTQKTGKGIRNAEKRNSVIFIEDF